MRYLISAKVRPGRIRDAVESGRFGDGFPYGDLGETLRKGHVDERGTIRWVEVCYCREAYGVAMEEELPYFEEYLTDLTIVDATDPALCQGYPVCSTCDCTKRVRPKGTPFLHFFSRAIETDLESHAAGKPTRWLGWKGTTTDEEARRNESNRG